SDTFAPTPLTFVLDGFSLRIENVPAATAEPGAAPADALHPSQPGVVPHRAPASMKLLVGKVRVTTARTIGFGGLARPALLPLAGLMLARRNRGDGPAKIPPLGGGPP